MRLIFVAFVASLCVVSEQSPHSREPSPSPESGVKPSGPSPKRRRLESPDSFDAEYEFWENLGKNLPQKDVEEHFRKSPSPEVIEAHKIEPWTTNNEDYKRDKTYRQDMKQGRVEVYKTQHTKGHTCILKHIAQPYHADELAVAQRMFEHKYVSENVSKIYAWFQLTGNILPSDKHSVYFVSEYVQTFPNSQLLYESDSPPSSPKSGRSSPQDDKNTMAHMFKRRPLLPDAYHRFLWQILNVMRDTMRMGILNLDLTLNNIIIAAEHGAKDLSKMTKETAYKHARAVVIDFGYSDVKPDPSKTHPDMYVDAPLPKKMCENLVELIFRMTTGDNDTDEEHIPGRVIAESEKHKKDDPVYKLLHFILGGNKEADKCKSLKEIMAHDFFKSHH